MLTGTQTSAQHRRFVIASAASFALALFTLSPLSANASELDDLRASGAVGEAFDGFTRARSGSAKSFSKKVNKKRRSIYVKRAKSEGVNVDQVGRVYAKKIFGDLPSGTWLLSENGKWSQKK